MKNRKHHQSHIASGGVVAIERESTVRTDAITENVTGENLYADLEAPTLQLSAVQRHQRPLSRPQQVMAWNRKHKILSCIIVLVVLLGMVGIVRGIIIARATPDVVTYNVGSSVANNAIGGGGIVFPEQQIDISYPAPESATSVFVKVGDRVSTKQPLIQLDLSQINTQLNQSNKDMAAAKAYLNSVSAAGTSQQIAQAQEQYNLAQDKYDALVAQNSSPTMHQGTLVSPINGIVIAVNTNPGQAILASKPLVTIADESKVIVHIKIPLSNLGQVHIGQPAMVSPSALPNVTLNGTVTSIAPQADPQTDTFEVWVEVGNSNTALLPGMSAFAHIQNQKAVSAVGIPRLAVLDPDSQASVFIVRNGRAYIQGVGVVGRASDAVLVNHGLSKGDQVVLVGINNLQDGQKVRVTRVVAWQHQSV